MSFGRLPRSRASTPLSQINVTPLVDVMLVLLVIFMLAAPLMTSRIKMELPRTPATGAADAGGVSERRVLALDASGQLYWQDQAITAVDLRQRLKELAHNQPETEIHLRVDQSVAHGLVVQLMADIQQAGLQRIGFVAQTTKK